VVWVPSAKRVPSGAKLAAVTMAGAAVTFLSTFALPSTSLVGAA
jgi:hypothetical protein